MKKTRNACLFLSSILTLSQAVIGYSADSDSNQSVDPDVSVETVIAARIDKPAEAKPENRAEASSASVPKPSKPDAEPVPAQKNQTSAIFEAAQFLSALEKKQAELNTANKEIARLQELIQKMLQVNRKEQANMHYNMGCAYKAGRLYNKAESAFLAALSLTPDDPAVHYNLGVLYDDDLKNKDKAREHYKKFLQLAPDDPDAAQVQEWLILIPGN